MRHRAQKSITGPERRKERETFCVRFGKWTRFLRWRTQLHKTTRIVSRFSIYTALLDVLKSRVMKRTSISYCAMRDFAISAMANSTTQDVRHRAQKSTTGPERRKERKTFCVRYGKWTRFLRWRTQLHKTTRNASRFSIYIALLDVLES